MIVLEVQEYCHSCPYFDAVVERGKKLYSGADVVETIDTVVRCEHRKLCENIKRYLGRKVENNEQSESK